jgi:hypothetical protein
MGHSDFQLFGTVKKRLVLQVICDRSGREASCHLLDTYT